MKRLFHCLAAHFLAVTLPKTTLFLAKYHKTFIMPIQFISINILGVRGYASGFLGIGTELWFWF